MCLPSGSQWSSRRLTIGMAWMMTVVRVVSTQPPRSQISPPEILVPRRDAQSLYQVRKSSRSSLRLMSSPVVNICISPNPPPVLHLLQRATFSLPPRPKSVIPSRPVPISRNSTHTPRLPPRSGNPVSTLMGVPITPHLPSRRSMWNTMWPLQGGRGSRRTPESLPNGNSQPPCSHDSQVLTDNRRC